MTQNPQVPLADVMESLSRAPLHESGEALRVILERHFREWPEISTTDLGIIFFHVYGLDPRRVFGYVSYAWRRWRDHERHFFETLYNRIDEFIEMIDQETGE